MLPHKKVTSIEELIEGRRRQDCVVHINNIERLRRYDMLNQLSYKRLMRKHDDIIRTLTSVDYDWNQTMIIVLLRYIMGQSNRTQAERLGRLLSYHTIMRENSSLQNLEALFLGTAGLLDIYAEDEYVTRLNMEFRHLMNKYNITPMLAGEWHLSNIYNNAHPVLRLAQLASCIHQNMISMRAVSGCKSRNDVYRLFAGRASQYWVEHFIPKVDTSTISKRVGSFTSDILGINFIAPMLFAYGTYTENETYREQAMTLLEEIPAENNRYTQLWNCHSRIAENAYESQALIQLSREYCEKQLCAECPLAHLLLRQAQE